MELMRQKMGLWTEDANLLVLVTGQDSNEWWKIITCLLDWIFNPSIIVCLIYDSYRLIQLINKSTRVFQH